MERTEEVEISKSFTLDHKSVLDRKKSLKNKIDPKITNKIWKNMIWSYIDFERRNFKKK